MNLRVTHHFLQRLFAAVPSRRTALLRQRRVTDIGLPEIGPAMQPVGEPGRGACIVVRPGETDYQKTGRIAGTLDLPLTQTGEEQTAATIAELAGLNPHYVITGTKDPALSTARAIAQALGIPMKVTPDLNSVDMGLWEGLEVAEIRQKQPKLFKRWQETPADVTPPNGEDCETAAKRVEFALRKPLRKADSFVVVAAEPLATIVASLVRGEPVTMSGPACSAPPLVEVVDRAVVAI